MTYIWVEEFSLAQASDPNTLEFTLSLRVIVDELALPSLRVWGSEMRPEIAGQRKKPNTATSVFIMVFVGVGKIETAEHRICH